MGEVFRELPKESREDDSHFADFGEHKIDIYKLIDLSQEIKVKEIDINKLEGTMDGSYWYDKNGNWISPRSIILAYKNLSSFDEIIKRYPEWEDEVSKIKKANYKEYPIILIGDVVIDGVHRLTKAFIDGVEEINVKQFERLPEVVIVKSNS